jgi:hypothetical protein
MAQGDSQEILRQFQQLPDEDRHVLENELAMTGCSDQTFSRDTPSDKYVGKGPAILVYYAPALMQKAGRKDPRGAMMVLAEVLRHARELWPLEKESANRTVICRIDALKDQDVHQMRNPEVSHSFVLVKSSGQDGMVKLMPVSCFRKLDWNDHQLLNFVSREGRRWRPSTAYNTVRRLFGRLSLSSNEALNVG